MHLYYRWTIFRVTSAYTNASTLYGECTYYSGTIFRVTSAYTIASSLYGELMHLAIIAGLYSGLPQRIPMHLLYTVNAPIIAGLYIQGYLSVYQCIYFIR